MTSEQSAQIQRFCIQLGRGVLYDQASFELFDLPAGKRLSLSSFPVRSIEERRDAQSKKPYLLLVEDGGRQVALTEAGLAFSPDFGNSGPIPELPAAVCLSDFRTIVGRVHHTLHGHPDEAPSKDLVRSVMACIAILDGAKAIGLDVASEERELEGELEEIERRRGR